MRMPSAACDALEFRSRPLYLRSDRRLSWGIDDDPDSWGLLLNQNSRAGSDLAHEDTEIRVLKVKSDSSMER